MGAFRVFLIGSPEPLEVDLPVDDISALATLASYNRFIFGRATHAGEDGTIRHVMFATNRIQLIIEH